MCRLFPCIPIFRGFFLKKGVKGMRMFVGAKIHIDTCEKFIFCREKLYE